MCVSGVIEVVSLLIHVTRTNEDVVEPKINSSICDSKFFFPLLVD